MPYGQALVIHGKIADQEKKLTDLYLERDKQLALCLTNGYCPNCATKAKARAKDEGTFHEHCRKCETDFVVKAE